MRWSLFSQFMGKFGLSVGLALGSAPAFAAPRVTGPQFAHFLSMRKKAVSKPNEDLLNFFHMFYDSEGRPLTETEFLQQMVPNAQVPVTRRLRARYLTLFQTMAAKIWFVGRDEARVAAFTQDFYGRSLSAGIVQHLTTIYDRAETSVMPTASPFEETGSVDEKKEMTELISVIPQVCTARAERCMIDVMVGFDENPGLYSLLDEKSVTALIDFTKELADEKLQVWSSNSERHALPRVRQALSARRGELQSQSCSTLLLAAR